MTALSLDSVSVRLGDVVALRDVSLVVNPGSHVAIVGASGSGKTTLLRAIVGLLKIGSGTISIDGQTVTGPATFTPTHRRGVGYVPQDGALFPHLSVERNIRFGLPSRVNRDRQVREATELVALEPELLRRFPHELSGGQQQRVALARALAVRPRIVVLDEPFSALDTALREHARHSVIDVLKRSGITTLLVTHDQHEALTFGDAVGVLDRGQLVQAGPPQALFNDPATPEIAAFLADACFIAGEIAGNNATTALGPVRIRHQHGELGGVSRIMLRPNQFEVDTSGASPNARVVGVSWRGSTTRMILRPLTGGDDPVTIELPTRETGAVAPDYLLAIRVVGTGVAYMSVPPVKQSCPPRPRTVLTVVGDRGRDEQL